MRGGGKGSSKWEEEAGERGKMEKGGGSNVFRTLQFTEKSRLKASVAHISNREPYVIHRKLPIFV